MTKIPAWTNTPAEFVWAANFVLGLDEMGCANLLHLAALQPVEWLEAMRETALRKGDRRAADFCRAAIALRRAAGVAA